MSVMDVKIQIFSSQEEALSNVRVSSITSQCYISCFQFLHFFHISRDNFLFYCTGTFIMFTETDLKSFYCNSWHAISVERMFLLRERGFYFMVC
jgi:hypothetical protein